MNCDIAPEERRRRHRVTAEWYAANGHGEAAIQHALHAGEHATAAALLLAQIDTLVAHERLGLIERYADQLPIDVLIEHDALVNAAVIAYAFRRAFDKAEALISQHRRRLATSKAGSHAVGAHNVSRLFVLAAQDRIDELGATAIECAEQLDERRGFRYAVTFNARAMLLVGQAAYDEARGLLLQARPLHDEDGNLFGQAYQEAIYSMSLSGQGRIDDAVRGLAAALKRTEERSVGSIGAGSVIAAYLACGRYEQNRIDDAQALIRDYAQLAEQQTIVDAVAGMLLTAARIAHLQQRRAEAEELIERVLYLGYRYSLGRLTIYARAELARQATFDGEHDAAAKWLHELPAMWTDAPADQLLFHAGETEACTISWGRHLIAIGQHGPAARLLGSELRRARHHHRRRRELKLLVMLALAQQAGGDGGLARRSLLEALEIGAAGGFVRSFLDERQAVLVLLKALYGGFAQLPNLEGPDAAVEHLQRLLTEAGEQAPSAPSRGADVDLASVMASLSEKERRLLQFLARGLSNKDLADRLSVSTNTVKWHLRNIFEKLQIKNRVQAIALARRFGIID
nr:LuxR C-terminal-related transcriptional regulator [Solimonas marina]